jgi:hypothetical protein
MKEGTRLIIPGIIIRAITNIYKNSLPGNCILAKAKADREEIKSIPAVPAKATIIVFRIYGHISGKAA